MYMIYSVGNQINYLVCGIGNTRLLHGLRIIAKSIYQVFKPLRHTWARHSYCIWYLYRSGYRHNSGSYRYLYPFFPNLIQEIIKDIKFETFGCVAAIATSSIITELAKSKTLEEALNITKNDVIKALNGLPPIKVHCSLLSTDALFEAIYDYYTKHNSEKITNELEKRHQSILKSKEIIEEKYSDWVNEEEKQLE